MCVLPYKIILNLLWFPFKILFCEPRIKQSFEKLVIYGFNILLEFFHFYRYLNNNCFKGYISPYFTPTLKKDF